MSRLLVLVLLLALGRLGALDASPSAAYLDEAEGDVQAIRDQERAAAAFRMGRSKATPEQRDDTKAKAVLDRARELLAQGSNWRARWKAKGGFEDHPYSVHAGDLLAVAIEGYAQSGDVEEVRQLLVRIFLWLPDYAGMGAATKRALEVAEQDQQFQAKVDLDAEKPWEVVRLEGSGFSSDTPTTRLFRFIANHGDRGTVAPRAALGLARAKLLSGDRDEILAARRAYEDFLERYPDHPLVFTALIETALSHLVTYRGPDYDLGALNMASATIDQAERETRGDTAQVAIIQGYRRRIRGWLQDRDLSVARWYRNRGEPAALAWLTRPESLRSPLDSARYYYGEAFRRDPTSPQGKAAERELAALPAQP